MDDNEGVASRTRLRNSRKLEEKKQQNARTMRNVSNKGNAKVDIVVLDSSDDDDDHGVGEATNAEFLGDFADFDECKSRYDKGKSVVKDGDRAKILNLGGRGRVVEDKESVFENWRRMHNGNADDGDGSGGDKNNGGGRDEVNVGDHVDDDSVDRDDECENEVVAPDEVDNVVPVEVSGGSDNVVPIEVSGGSDNVVPIEVSGGNDNVVPIEVSGGSDEDRDSDEDGDSIESDKGDVDDDDDYDEMSSSEEDCDNEDDPDFEEDEELEGLSDDEKKNRVKYVRRNEGRGLIEETGKDYIVKAKRKRDSGKEISVDAMEDGADDGNPGVKLKEEFGSGRKRKKISGDMDGVMDVQVEMSVDSNRDSSVHSSQGPACVARRTRSHSNFAIGKKDKNKSYLDDGDSSSECGGEEQPVNHVGGSRKRRKKLGPRCADFTDIMMRKILGGSLDEQRSGCDVASEGKLPQKFVFGIDEPTTYESSDSLEELWSEMKLAYASCEIDNNTDRFEDEVCSEDEICSEYETDGLFSCQKGQHEYILDEEIGLRCKFCHFVKTEIRFVMPEFCPNIWGNSQRNEWREKDQFSSIRLDVQDIGISSHAEHNLPSTEGTVWDIIPGVRESLFPHQREGFEFLWTNTAGGIYLEKLKENTGGGGGCIISHAPGTGKTRLTIVFLQTYLKLYSLSRPVIIAPSSMLMTWEEEFRKWKIDIPFLNLNSPELSNKEESIAQHLMAGTNVRHKKDIRMLKLYSWTNGNSILGLSYSLFEKLTSGGSSRKSKKGNEVQYTKEVQNYRRILFELPGILVFDEGHTPRNDQSNIFHAVSNIRTEKRIILSGTPFQNNFRELYNTLCLARPTFADRNQFGNRDMQKRSRKIRNQVPGKWTSLTSSIGKDGQFLDDRLKELRSMICPFVNVHRGTILQESLPGMSHSVFVLHPTKMQGDLLNRIEGSDYLTLENAASLVSVHSSLFLHTKFYEANKSLVNTELLKNLRLNPDAGVKIKFLIELIRLSNAVNERVLVFSQFLGPLNLIMDQLRSHFQWSEGREILYMYGQQDVKHRQSFIDAFNDTRSEARVLLASTKACREGINLIGASRVVLLDVVWNPSVEWQAISRAYRLGQKKFVYAYSLIAAGTKEAIKYQRQVEKDRLSKLVFSSSDGDRDKQELSEKISKDKILEEMLQHQKLKSMFAKIIDRPKECNLLEAFGSLNL